MPRIRSALLCSLKRSISGGLVGVNPIIMLDRWHRRLLGRPTTLEVSSLSRNPSTRVMKTNKRRQHCRSSRTLAIGPLFLLMLLIVSSFTSIVTELDAWRHISNLAKSILIVIATPATFDAVVESTTEGLESQDSPVKIALIKLCDDTQTVRPGIDDLHSVRYEPPSRQIRTCRADRPRGPPGSG